VLAVSSQQMQAIREQWLSATLRTYHGPTAESLLRKKDEFRNPIGHALRVGLSVLLDELFGQMRTAIFTPAMEDIVRIRAVQDFTPSQAVGFVFLLKEIVRRELTWPAEEFRAFEDRIDEMALFGFDLFMNCREKIYEVKDERAGTEALWSARKVTHGECAIITRCGFSCGRSRLFGRGSDQPAPDLRSGDPLCGALHFHCGVQL
jgi:hypothetical protein